MFGRKEMKVIVFDIGGTLMENKDIKTTKRFECFKLSELIDVKLIDFIEVV